MAAVRRLLLNVLTALSLLVCLAGVVAWGRSYEVGDAVFFTRGVRCVSVTSEGGSYAFSTFLRPKGRGVRWSWGSYAKRCTAGAAVRGLWLFGWAPEKVGAHDLVVPQWVVPAVFGSLPAVRVARWRRLRRRPDANTCRHCGYDLTGNVSGMCPECGAVAPVSSKG